MSRHNMHVRRKKQRMFAGLKWGAGGGGRNRGRRTMKMKTFRRFSRL